MDAKATVCGKRSLDVGGGRFLVVGANRAVLHAARWLMDLGCDVSGAASLAAARAARPPALALLIGGDRLPAAPGDPADGVPELYLWDFEVNRPGVGDFACAVSGVSTVIGPADGLPGVMPARMPEKWVGLFGASLALSLRAAADRGGPRPKRIDVSAADLLRAFSEQNSGNHAGVPYGWRRNGRTAVEHGGVFPQGFFPCRDGYMAIQARSRPDWRAILAALGDPAWAQESVFQNPFKLSEDDSRVRPLLEAELMKHDRRDLLDRAVETGAPIAPVLSLEEARSWDVFRPAFFDGNGRPRAPFTVRRAAGAGGE